MTIHRRLVEKWIYEDLTDEELARLPEELKERTRAYFQDLVDEGLRSAEENGWVDGPKAMERIRAELFGKPRGTSWQMPPWVLSPLASAELRAILEFIAQDSGSDAIAAKVMADFTSALETLAASPGIGWKGEHLIGSGGLESFTNHE